MDFDRCATEETVRVTMEALEARNVRVDYVTHKEQALELITSYIPEGASVMTGASETLEQIGFTRLLLSEAHPWNNLKAELVAEQDPERQAALRRRAALADYWLGSVHAITQDGIALTASASGSQLPAYAYTAPNVIWVAGAQKIVSDLEMAFRRVREYVFPLEDERMRSVGAPGSNFGKWLIFERETSPLRQMRLILVDEKLGF